VKSNPWTESEINTLKREYDCPGGFDVGAISELLKRTKASVYCKAGHIGISVRRGTQKRTAKAIENGRLAQIRIGEDPEIKINRSLRMLDWHKNNEHPRGMLGKHHSSEARLKISAVNSGRIRPVSETMKSMATKLMRYGNLSPGVRRGTWVAAWREIGGKRKFFRSRWEANYARYLQFQKENGLISDWTHECDTFWFEGIKRGCVTYLPDFKVELKNGNIEYHEVKGWMDAASKTKIKRMKKYHPDVVLKVFDSKWYRANQKKLSCLIKGWE
jgi:hypothetical protein